MTQLRRLHRSASKKAKTWAIVLGIMGSLILGTGMSLCMTELSGFLGGTAMIIGIPVLLKLINAFQQVKFLSIFCE